MAACAPRRAYYAPNTYKQLKLAERARAVQRGEAGAQRALPPDFDPDAALTLLGALVKPRARGGLFGPGEFLGRVLLPMFAARFVLLPAPLLLAGLAAGGGPAGGGLALGASLFKRAVLHLALADALTNLHGFLTIVTNHAGRDLYRFSQPCSPGSPTFMLRQVIPSAVCRSGPGATKRREQHAGASLFTPTTAAWCPPGHFVGQLPHRRRCQRLYARFLELPGNPLRFSGALLILRAGV